MGQREQSMTYTRTLWDALKGVAMEDADDVAVRRQTLLEHIKNGNKENRELRAQVRNLQTTLVELQANPTTVIMKDPRGLIKNDLEKIRTIMDTKPYKVGDSIEKVADKAAQERLYQSIVKHLVAPKITTL